jgi:multidrug transporter EmrE-like cation transporter
MERNKSQGSSAQRERDEGERNVRSGVFAWWYRHFAPSGLVETASLAQRERVRRGRTASIVMLIFMLFLLTMLSLSIVSQDYHYAIAIGLGIGGTMLAFLLSRKGSIKVAAILVLVIVYAGGIFSLVLDGGLTANNTFLLDFMVIPDVVVLAFFSANSLFPIVWLNVLLIWLLVVFGPHDATISDILHRAPLQIFVHVYVLQLVIASTLYLWARSTELALQRADRAEEVVALEKHENERKQLELEQKNQLDAGVQQILQTHVAVANGDLNARAPLSQDHMLWQVAVVLNNLIARLQSLSHTESELRQQIWEGNERATDHHKATYGEAGKITGAQRALPSETGRVTGAQRALPSEVGRVTGAQRALPSEVGRVTGAQRALPSEVGRVTGAQRALPPGRTTGVQKAQRSKPGITGQQPRVKGDGVSRPEAGSTGDRLRALRLEQEVVHPERSDAKEGLNKHNK